MLLSSDARNGASGSQLDSQEAQAQIERSHELQLSMAGTAQKHNAGIKDDKGQAEPAPDQLPAIAQMANSVEVLKGTDGGGGQTPVTAYTATQLQLSSPAGIAATTPANAILAAGNTGSVTAGQDINFAAQGNSYYLVKAGLSLFTYGKAGNKDKPNQETGIKLHAATGKVSSQSQSDKTSITADKAVTVASVTQSVNIAAKEHVLMTAQGAYLKLEGGNIMIHGPGKMDFKASMKELTGPASSQASLPALPKAADIDRAIELNLHYGDLEPVVNSPYKITFANGTSRNGLLDAKGHARVENVPPGEYHVEYGEDQREWVAPPLAPDPQLLLARQQQDQATALLEAARANKGKGTRS